MYLILILFSVTGLALWKYLRNYFNFWKNQGVPERPSFFASYQKHKTTISNWDLENYRVLKGHKFGGMWEMGHPVLYLRDLDLIKQIFVRDFEYFVNRRTFPTKNEADHTKLMLSFRETGDWKELRNILTPAFSTVKMRRLFTLFDSCARRYTEYLESKSRQGGPIEFRGAMGRYTMACISESIFGIDCHAFAEEQTTFFKMGKRYMDFNPGRVFKLVFVSNYPKLSSFLRLNVFDQEADAYITQVVQNLLQHREKHPQGVWNDFLEILRENSVLCKKTSTYNIIDDDKKLLSSHEIVAQCLNFFAAGSDSIETLLIWAAYELARNPEIQARLYREVSKVYDENDGQLTFDSMMEMEYLEMFISECLRMYPPTQRAERRCLKDYKIEDSNFTVPKGLFAHIPIYPIHHDPDHWTEPEVFNPERFTKENKAKRHPIAFMPFGHGLRNCIAARFSVTEAKVCIVHLVQKFALSPCAQTEEKPTYFHLSLKPLNGTWLKLTPRKN